MWLVKEIYNLTSKFPVAEQYALSCQLQRAAISIPSNIAEGSGRTSVKDFTHFASIALGSAYEVETQLLIVKDLEYGEAEKLNMLIKKIESIQKQLNLLIKELSTM